MLFNDFLTKIQDLELHPLGGQKAQFKLAPDLRLSYNKQKINALNPKKAAVLALFYPNKHHQTSFLLTKRARYKGTHSSQISFPGGKIDPLDSNLKTTALRETFEEVGIKQKQIFVVRELTDVYIPPSNFLVTPFLGYTKTTPIFNLNHEVASTIQVNLADLLNDANLDTMVINNSYMQKVTVPCFKFNNNLVWGATGMMLSEIKELIKAITL